MSQWNFHLESNDIRIYEIIIIIVAETVFDQHEGYTTPCLWQLMWRCDCKCIETEREREGRGRQHHLICVDCREVCINIKLVVDRMLRFYIYTISSDTGVDDQKFIRMWRQRRRRRRNSWLVRLEAGVETVLTVKSSFDARWIKDLSLQTCFHEILRISTVSFVRRVFACISNTHCSIVHDNSLKFLWLTLYVCCSIAQNVECRKANIN